MKIVDISAAPQLAATLAQWHYAEWAAMYPDESFDDFLGDLTACLQTGIVPSTFVAVDGTPLGSVSIITRDMDTRPEYSPWLANVFVAPQHRCRGIGSLLVRHAMDAARAAGLKTLYLLTPGDPSFYRRLGWSALARERYHGRNVTVMQVSLKF